MSHRSFFRSHSLIKSVCFLAIGFLVFDVLRRDARPSLRLLPSSTSPPPPPSFHNREFVAAFKNYTDCLTAGLLPFQSNPANFYMKIHFVVGNCSDILFNVEVQSLKGEGEVKHHILADDENATCTVVTLGVGGEVRAEQLLLNASSQCVFHGADPIPGNNEKLYSQFGTFYPVAVGAAMGLSTASVLLPKGGYAPRKVIHIDLINFLTHFVKKKFIDQLLMDAEGAEFAMMEFFYEGGQLEKNGITICQLNMEAHALMRGAHAKFRDFINRILKEQRYVLLRNEFQAFNRIFLVNYHEPECINKYLTQFFFY